MIQSACIFSSIKTRTRYFLSLANWGSGM